MKQPATDEDILAAIPNHGVLTAYIASIVRHKKQGGVETAWVLRQLKRLEREGKVWRTPNNYRTQISWART